MTNNSYKFGRPSNEPQRAKTYHLTWAPGKDPNQPAHPHSLIRIFVFRMKKSFSFCYSKHAQGRLWMTMPMRRLIWIIAGRIFPKIHFLTLRLDCISIICLGIFFSKLTLSYYHISVTRDVYFAVRVRFDSWKGGNIFGKWNNIKRKYFEIMATLEKVLNFKPNERVSVKTL